MHLAAQQRQRRAFPHPGPAYESFAAAFPFEETPDQAAAFALAKKRASRLSAWIWIGHEENALTYARPTSRALLAVGPTRLKDLPIEGGERLALQLDIGLLPLELRTAFRQTFLDPTRPPLVQNQIGRAHV